MKSLFILVMMQLKEQMNFKRLKVENVKLQSNHVIMSSISTPQIDGVKVGDTENFYDGWQKISVFVSNESDTEQKITLSLTFGPTSIVDSAAGSYKTGFAAFTGFETYSIDEKMFDYATASTYSKVLNLTEAEEEENEDSEEKVEDNTEEDVEETDEDGEDN